MSWDLDLVTPAGDTIVSTNYTHNVNRMIEAALIRIGHAPTLSETSQPWFARGPLGDRAWWQILHGMSGPDGAIMLATIAAELDRDPVRYDQMNPANGWGSRAHLVQVLRDLVRSVPEDIGTRWETSG